MKKRQSYALMVGMGTVVVVAMTLIFTVMSAGGDEGARPEEGAAVSSIEIGPASQEAAPDGNVLTLLRARGASG